MSYFGMGSNARLMGKRYVHIRRDSVAAIKKGNRRQWRRYMKYDLMGWMVRSPVISLEREIC